MKLSKGMLMAALITGTLSWGASSAMAAEELQEFTLDPLIVTANRYEKTNLETAADTVVLTSERIANSGATNLMQALASVPGVIYQEKGPGGGSLGTMTSKVSFRGVEKGTLVLVDGSPINYRGLYNLEDIPVEDIERVEIVKGGGAVLYGSEATGGVVNIITKKRLANSVKVGLGNHDRQNYGVSLNADKLSVDYNYDKWGKVGKVSSSRTVLDDYSKTKEMYNSFKGMERNVFGMKYEIDENMNVQMRHGKTKSHYAYTFGDGYAAKLLDVARYKRNYEKKEDFVQFNFKDNNGLKGNVFYNRNDWETTGVDLYSSTGSTKGYPSSKFSREKNLTYGYDVQKLWQEKANNYLLGTSFQREQFQDCDSKDAWNESRKRNVFSLYGSWETGLGTNDLFTLSARETKTTAAAEDKNFNNFSAQGQYVHKIDKEQSAYLTVGTSYVLPTFSAMYSVPDGGLTVGDSSLQPAKGKHLELGYKHANDSHKFTAALFATRINDNLTFSKQSGSKGNPDKYYATNEEFKNYGLELTGEFYTKNGFTFTSGLTFANPQCKTKTDKTNVITDWQRTFGKVQLQNGITYHKDKWTANLTTNYLASRVMQSNTKGVAKTKPYLLTTFNVKYAPTKNQEIALSMDNILDRQDNTNHSSSYYYSTPYSYLLSYKVKF